MNKPRAVIFDIDGCLTKKRDRKLKGGLMTLAEYEKGYPYDVPQEWSRYLANVLDSHGVDIIMCTARSPRHRGATIKWLSDHGIPCDELYMRDVDDTRTADKIKKDIYLNKISKKYNILMALDDHKSVCDMFRSLGVAALDCDGAVEVPIKDLKQ